MNTKKLNKMLFLILFYLCSFTWALPTTILGGLIGIVLMIVTKKHYKFGPCICLPLGDRWGFELGLWFIGCDDNDYDLSCHEFGHQLQACILGPFTLFVATIPSIIRFWMREMPTMEKKRKFAWTLYGSAVGLGAIVFGLGACFSVYWLAIEGACVLVYASIINLWLQFEIGLYAGDVFPDYDDFWVEGMATKFGTKIMKMFY